MSNPRMMLLQTILSTVQAVMKTDRPGSVHIEFDDMLFPRLLDIFRKCGLLVTIKRGKKPILKDAPFFLLHPKILKNGIQLSVTEMLITMQSMTKGISGESNLEIEIGDRFCLYYEENLILEKRILADVLSELKRK